MWREQSPIRLSLVLWYMVDSALKLCMFFFFPVDHKQGVVKARVIMVWKIIIYALWGANYIDKTPEKNL